MLAITITRTSMNIEKKSTILRKIYQIYDKFTEGLDSACKKYCAECCTTNVSITTLEGYNLIRELNLGQREELKLTLEQLSGSERFRPQLTTNRIADLCRQGYDVPDENYGAQTQACPLLEQRACRIYPLRPFGCRCFGSSIPCRTSGAANMDDFVLSVNTVFLQTIENVDQNGFTGNLIDVYRCLLSSLNRNAYRSGHLDGRPAGLISNKPLTTLMVPLEHRKGLKPIISALHAL